MVFDFDDLFDGLEFEETQPEAAPAPVRPEPAEEKQPAPVQDMYSMDSFDSFDEYVETGDDTELDDGDLEALGIDMQAIGRIRAMEEEEAYLANSPEALAAMRRKREEARRLQEAEDTAEQDGFEIDDIQNTGTINDDDEEYADEIADREKERAAEDARVRRRSSRKSARQDEIDRRAYGISRDPAAASDDGYDGYYENVIPDDNGKSTRGGINWPLVGGMAGVVLGFAAATYYIITTLGF